MASPSHKATVRLSMASVLRTHQRWPFRSLTRSGWCLYLWRLLSFCRAKHPLTENWLLKMSKMVMIKLNMEKQFWKTWQRNLLLSLAKDLTIATCVICEHSIKRFQYVTQCVTNWLGHIIANFRGSILNEKRSITCKKQLVQTGIAVNCSVK